jgi:protein-disulfide isomerase
LKLLQLSFGATLLLSASLVACNLLLLAGFAISSSNSYGDGQHAANTIVRVEDKVRDPSTNELIDQEVTRVTKEMKRPKHADIRDRAFVGGENARVTIVEWDDFTCDHCLEAFETMVKLRNEYKDRIRIVYKQFPILSKDSQTAAEYMEAIALQDKGKALKFHDSIYRKQSTFRDEGEQFIKKVAKEVGADLTRAQNDRKGSVVQKRIDGDIEEAREFDFTSTPCFLVNGAAVHGAYPFAFFKKVIDITLASNAKS